MEAMKISRVSYAFAFLACIAIYVAYMKWNLDSNTILGVTEAAAGNQRNPLGHQAPINYPAVFYGIMFDAGSTGTRIHIFKFTQDSKETPKLTHETFKALKPGLSAYADDVDKSAQGINELLEVAKDEIPVKLQKSTPLVLKATAGLRLLPGEKAQKLLDKVKEIFQASPFFVREDYVSIMNGTDEGRLNLLRYFLRQLPLSGSLVLTTLQTSPAGHITSFQLFSSTYKLYSYSYLGLGLMSARLAILGGVEGQACEYLGEGQHIN
uniref:nucleoside diphosphate phosphatase n=1 Tax=Sphenodon punctatus TaxID=8508 RepID=A0A8D0H3M4_SPHPU